MSRDRVVVTSLELGGRCLDGACWHTRVEWSAGRQPDAVGWCSDSLVASLVPVSARTGAGTWQWRAELSDGRSVQGCSPPQYPRPRGKSKARPTT